MTPTEVLAKIQAAAERVDVGCDIVYVVPNATVSDPAGNEEPGSDTEVVEDADTYAIRAFKTVEKRSNPLMGSPTIQFVIPSGQTSPALVPVAGHRIRYGSRLFEVNEVEVHDHAGVTVAWTVNCSETVNDTE